MQIEYKRLDEIKPYENNPRKNDEAVQYVANSIRSFGFKVPIVIDRKGVIVAGHTRYKAAKILKLKEVPCVVADELSDEQIRHLGWSITKRRSSRNGTGTLFLRNWTASKILI